MNLLTDSLNLKEFSDSYFLFSLRQAFNKKMTVSRLATFLDVDSADICSLLNTKNSLNYVLGNKELFSLSKKYLPSQELSLDEINSVLKGYKKAISSKITSKETLKLLIDKVYQLEIALDYTGDAFVDFESIEISNARFVEVSEIELGRFRRRVSDKLRKTYKLKSKPNNCKTYTISFLTTKFYNHDLNSDDELSLKAA